MQRAARTRGPSRALAPQGALLGVWARRDRRDEAGFTLLEVLIVALVTPIILGAISAGLIAVFSVQGSVSNRLSDSGDAQVVSANFVQDVQSSLRVTTDALAAQCGPGTQVLGFESNYDPVTATYKTVITYASVKSGSVYLLRRQYCASGPSATYDGATTISYGISVTPAPTATVAPAASNLLAQQGWIPVSSVDTVTLSVYEPASKYTFTLTGSPAASGPKSNAGSPITVQTNTQCGFAPTQGGTVQNGTYAQTLCFVDFSSYNAAAAAAPNCQEMVASIPGGDTLSFCLSTSGTQPIVAAALPTYPQAFLGNTIGGAPFYTGLGCPDSTATVDGLGNPTPSCIKPALYQTNTGAGPTNTITVTNITVTTPTGVPATGWHFVSADAETTDVSESITWISDKTLTIVPDTPTSSYGNTCNNTPSGSNGPSGNGTNQITCASGANETSSIKTGTPLVDALQPSTMTVSMKGAGLEGIALGLLLS